MIPSITEYQATAMPKQTERVRTKQARPASSPAPKTDRWIRSSDSIIQEARSANISGRYRTLSQLKARDQLVRRHEMTHAAALGPGAGAIRYKYKTGPDGQLYATGGSTSVRIRFDSSNPTQNYRKAAQVRRAAMAVPEPSSADVAIAVKAARIQQQALADMARNKQA
jgi:hypothetical protein